MIASSLASSFSAATFCLASLLAMKSWIAWRQRAALDRGRIGDDAVAPLPQAAPVLGDHQPGVGVDSAQPVARPFERFELRLVVGHFTVVRRFAGFEVELRAGFVADPAPVMKHRGAHQRCVGSRLLECVVAPVRGEQPRELGVIVLRDHDDRAIGLVSDNHGHLPVVSLAAQGARAPRVGPILRDPRVEGEL